MQELLSIPVRVYYVYSEPIAAPQGFETNMAPLDKNKWKQFGDNYDIRFQIMIVENKYAMVKVVWNGKDSLEETAVSIMDSERLIQFNVKSPSISCKYIRQMNGSIYLRRFQILLKNDDDFMKISTVLCNLHFVVKDPKVSLSQYSQALPPMRNQLCNNSQILESNNFKPACSVPAINRPIAQVTKDANQYRDHLELSKNIDTQVQNFDSQVELLPVQANTQKQDVILENVPQYVPVSFPQHVVNKSIETAHSEFLKPPPIPPRIDFNKILVNKEGRSYFGKLNQNIQASEPTIKERLADNISVTEPVIAEKLAKGIQSTEPPVTEQLAKNISPSAVTVQDYIRTDSTYKNQIPFRASREEETDVVVALPTTKKKVVNEVLKERSVNDVILKNGGKELNTKKNESLSKLVITKKIINEKLKNKDFMRWVSVFCFCFNIHCKFTN